MSKGKHYTREEIDKLSQKRQMSGKPLRKYLIYGPILPSGKQNWYFISDLPTNILNEAVLSSNSIYLPGVHQRTMLKEVCRRLEKAEK